MRTLFGRKIKEYNAPDAPDFKGIYKLEYRHKRSNGRWTPWRLESHHENVWEATLALGQHVSMHGKIGVRIITKWNDEVIAEYKFK